MSSMETTDDHSITSHQYHHNDHQIISKFKSLFDSSARKNVHSDRMQLNTRVTDSVNSFFDVFVNYLKTLAINDCNSSDKEHVQLDLVEKGARMMQVKLYQMICQDIVPDSSKLSPNSEKSNYELNLQEILHSIRNIEGVMTHSKYMNELEDEVGDCGKCRNNELCFKLAQEKIVKLRTLVTAMEQGQLVEQTVVGHTNLERHYDPPVQDYQLDFDEQESDEQILEQFAPQQHSSDACLKSKKRPKQAVNSNPILNHLLNQNAKRTTLEPKPTQPVGEQIVQKTFAPHPPIPFVIVPSNAVTPTSLMKTFENNQISNQKQSTKPESNPGRRKQTFDRILNSNTDLMPLQNGSNISMRIVKTTSPNQQQQQQPTNNTHHQTIKQQQVIQSFMTATTAPRPVIATAPTDQLFIINPFQGNSDGNANSTIPSSISMFNLGNIIFSTPTSTVKQTLPILTSTATAGITSTLPIIVNASSGPAQSAVPLHLLNPLSSAKPVEEETAVTETDKVQNEVVNDDEEVLFLEEVSKNVDQNMNSGSLLDDVSKSKEQKSDEHWKHLENDNQLPEETAQNHLIEPKYEQFDEQEQLNEKFCEPSNLNYFDNHSIEPNMQQDNQPYEQYHFQPEQPSILHPHDILSVELDQQQQLPDAVKERDNAMKVAQAVANALNNAQHGNRINNDDNNNNDPGIDAFLLPPRPQMVSKRILMDSHLLQVHRIMSYKCFPDCGRVFTDLESLNDHLSRVHCEITKYRCRRCPSLFTNYAELFIHEERFHPQLGAVSCPVGSGCTFKVGWKELCQEANSWILPYRGHKGILPCPIQFCDKTCTNFTNMTRHIKTHREDRPIQCTICMEKFKDRKTCVTHARYLHFKGKVMQSFEINKFVKDLGDQEETVSVIRPISFDGASHNGDTLISNVHLFSSALQNGSSGSFDDEDGSAMDEATQSGSIPNGSFPNSSLLNGLLSKRSSGSNVSRSKASHSRSSLPNKPKPKPFLIKQEESPPPVTHYHKHLQNQKEYEDEDSMRKIYQQLGIADRDDKQTKSKTAKMSLSNAAVEGFVIEIDDNADEYEDLFALHSAGQEDLFIPDGHNDAKRDYIRGAQTDLTQQAPPSRSMPTFLRDMTEAKAPRKVVMPTTTSMQTLTISNLRSNSNSGGKRTLNETFEDECNQSAIVKQPSKVPKPSKSSVESRNETQYPDNEFDDEFEKISASHRPILKSDASGVWREIITTNDEHGIPAKIERIDCSYCGDNKFKFLTDMYDHLLDVHKMHPHPCPAAGCGKNFHYAKAVGTHVKSHKNVAEWPCYKCELVFPMAKQLTVHLRAVHITGVFGCIKSECNFKARFRKAIYDHVRIHHTDNKWADKEDDLPMKKKKPNCKQYRVQPTSVSTIPQHHQPIPNGIINGIIPKAEPKEQVKLSQLVCYYCRTPFTSRTLLNEHICMKHTRLQGRIRNYSCAFVDCSFSCTQMAEIVKHLEQMHSNSMENGVNRLNYFDITDI